MTLNEKLVNSTPTKTYNIPLSKLGIQSPTKRAHGLIIFIFSSAFTIFTKVFLKSDSGNLTESLLNASLICIVINIILMFILQFISSSVFALNHNYLYRIVLFLSNVAKVFVFFFTFLAYANKILTMWNDYLNEYYPDKIQMTYYLNNNGTVFNNLKIEIYKFDYIYGTYPDIDEINSVLKDFITVTHCQLTLLLFLFSLSTFGSTFTFFLTKLLSLFFYSFAYWMYALFCLIPIMNILVLITFWKKKKTSFKYYRQLDPEDDVVQMEVRTYKKLDKNDNFLKNFVIYLPYTIITIISYVLCYQAYKGNIDIFSFVDQIFGI